MPEVGQDVPIPNPSATDKVGLDVPSNLPPPNEASDATPTSTAAMESQGQSVDDDVLQKAKELRIDTEGGHTESKDLPASPPPPVPPNEQDKPYLDTTPKTPTMSRFNSVHNRERDIKDESEDIEQGQTIPSSEKGVIVDNDNDNESVSEIQSIMDQFIDEGAAPSNDAIMSPKHEAPGPLLDAPGNFPPRRSSLEPLRSRDMDFIAQSPSASVADKLPGSPPPVPPKTDSIYSFNSVPPLSTGSTTSLPKQLPEPDPEPELPFDFHRFLEQLRHKSADPVAKFLRSFLHEFGKKQWMVHEQVKIISDFLSFITNKMAQCEVWREVSDNEFDNAKEGMEKLVMNRLYSQTFSPAISPPAQPARGRGKRKELEKVLGPGRRGQHQEDVERDEILAQKIRIYSWVKEEHLDIAPVGPNGERFLRLAQQELLKIKGYRAPRDKIICILNCCKVIFGLLKNASSSDTSADSFVPLLIFVVLQSNPEHLISNIQYILRFRNQDKLGGEAGYYLSSLSGAIQFIESLDRTTLTVSDEDFEHNVELAVSAIAEQTRAKDLTSPRARSSEKSTLANVDNTPRTSLDFTSSSPRKSASRDGRASSSNNADANDDEPGVAGLLRTIQKPLSTIGRMFSDQDSGGDQKLESGTPQRRLSPAKFPSTASDSPAQKPPGSPALVVSYDAQEAAARQASAEAAEARRIQKAEHRTVVDTLCGMFPNLDREVIDDVVRQKQGRVGLAVDACLALTATG